MSKRILRSATLQLACGQAKPGASLSSWGLNMPLFCREFNARTSTQTAGKIVVVKIEVFEDKSFIFEVKGTPTSLLLKNVLQGKVEKVLSDIELDELVNLKKRDMNTENQEKIRKSILGSLKSFGAVNQK